ncbi:MAG: tetratricopeptide repeat protein [Phycisphaerales bacterium]|nr:tetratricopeptide repeat protein [Phycisphaerales bacterium]
MVTRRAKKLLIVGWDAADWILIDAILARGKMPNLKRLIEAGVRADLATLEPKLSPLLWSSIATGKTADKHGILNFVEPTPEGDALRVSSSTTRSTKALWNILTQEQMRVNVIAWYASHPAEAISGVCVTNLFQDGEPGKTGVPWPIKQGTVHPEACSERIAARRVGVRDISRTAISQFIPAISQTRSDDTRPQTLAKQLARMRTVHGAALEVLNTNREWDCTMVFYETIDTVGHHFMEYFPPRMAHVSKDDARLYAEVMPRVYEAHDHALGELLAAAGADTTVLLLSDHGFHSGLERPVTRNLDPLDRAAVEASWHRPFGVLVMSGPGVAQGATVHSPTLLAITPTALALLGLSVGQDMDGRVLAEALAGSYERREIPSWDAVDGECGMHPADGRQDPFESADALKQLIDLGYMPSLEGNVQASIALARRESQANLAVVYMSTARPALAVPILEQLVKDNPDESRFVVNLGNCLLALREHSRAVALLTPFHQRHRENAEVGIQLVASLAQSGQLDEARRLADLLERSTPARPDLALAWGDLRSLLGQNREAAAHYERAKAHDAKEPRPSVGLARIALHDKCWDEAVEHCLDACEKRHLTPEAHDLLGVALAWLGDHAHAIQSFGHAVAMRPGLVDAHRFLVTLAEAEGDSAKAAAHSEAVAKLMADATLPPPPAELWGPAAFAASLLKT